MWQSLKRNVENVTSTGPLKFAQVSSHAEPFEAARTVVTQLSSPTVLVRLARPWMALSADAIDGARTLSAVVIALTFFNI